MIAIHFLMIAAATVAFAQQATLSGEPRQWHKLTLTIDGPEARESDSSPNPFLDYRMTVEFRHSGGSVHAVPGYFAADGDAANSGADSGNKWRAHLAPDKVGAWTYLVKFEKGKGAAVDKGAAADPLRPFHGVKGQFRVTPSNKAVPDLRAQGRLQYVGRRYLRFAGSGEYYLKAGPDAPETMLAYRDFDATVAGKTGLKSWDPHVRDWRAGDPTWAQGKGKGLVGAMNYLASKGMNVVSFLTYNAGGDGDNVWPFAARNDKLHYDCSKLDQWGIVFDHAQSRGIYLHFKMQENENDDDRIGRERRPQRVPESLDGGRLGVERKLYTRELVARFGHALALNWNMGEENTQSTAEQNEWARYIRDTDPYDHHVVVHTFPPDQDAVYRPLLGKDSPVTGISLQNMWRTVHERTAHWVRESAGAGYPWVVANDEQGPADLGVPPDPGYAGWNGRDRKGAVVHDIHDVRKYVLWANLMAGGAGVEYYFGYQLPENDLVAEDFRSRDQSWNYARIALGFFREHRVPFWDMESADENVGGRASDGPYCFRQVGKLYLVYLPNGGPVQLDLTGHTGRFAVDWFDPRVGGAMRKGSVATVEGGRIRELGRPPGDPGGDWLIVVRK